MAIKKTSSDTSTSVVKVKKTAKKVAVKKTTPKTAVKKSAVSKPKAASAKKTVAKKAAPKNRIAKTVAEKSEAQKLIDIAVEGILEKKGRNISVLNLQNIHSRVCDYYIICQADSNTQVAAIANSVEDMVKKQTGERPYHSEGFQNSEWVLIDYVNIVVHVFQSHIREFYNLESLWADAEVTEIAFE